MHDESRISRKLYPAVFVFIIVWAMFGQLAAGGIAQELSPRSFWPAPKGTKVAVFGYSYSSGDVLMDPSLPIYGGESRIHTGFMAYMQTFSLWGRTSNFVIELPYSWGNSKGFFLEYPIKGDFSGFNDLGVTLAVNLFGAPSIDWLNVYCHPFARKQKEHKGSSH